LEKNGFEGVGLVLVLNAARSDAIHSEDEGICKSARDRSGMPMRMMMVHEPDMGFFKAVRPESLPIEKIGENEISPPYLGDEIGKGDGDLLPAVQEFAPPSVPAFGKLLPPSWFAKITRGNLVERHRERIDILSLYPGDAKTFVHRPPWISPMAFFPRKPLLGNGGKNGSVTRDRGGGIVFH
jgi:hypothetical protein